MARILIVDDEPSMLQVLQLNLNLEGHETFLASDGVTALRRIETELVDLVLLDVMMPVLDGWEVLKRLKDLKLKKRPRIVMMSAKSGSRSIELGESLGADRYVAKPFEIDELLTVIREILAEGDTSG